MESNKRQMLKVVIKLKFTLCAKETTAFVSERANWKLLDERLKLVMQVVFAVICWGGKFKKSNLNSQGIFSGNLTWKYLSISQSTHFFLKMAHFFLISAVPSDMQIALSEMFHESKNIQNRAFVAFFKLQHRLS